MTESAAASPATPGLSAGAARRVALIVATSFFMMNLDGAIINTSLPQMARAFGVRPVDLNIGITAYILTTAAFVPLSGWVADRHGARKVFAWAIVVFTLASLACGFAQDLVQFTLARAVQGMGAALMTPVGRMVVLRNAEKKDLVAATALITWPALIAPVVGPALGGFITTYADWRWNFLLNAPLGLIGVVLVFAFIPDFKEEARRRFDTVGFVLSSAALIALLWGLEGLARGEDWAMAGAAALIGAVIGAFAIRHLNRADHPLIELSAVKILTFSIATLDAGNLIRLAISTTPFLLPLMFQVAFGLSAWSAGLFVLAYFAGNLLMKTVTTPALRLFGFRDVLVGNGVLAGLTIIACGFLTPQTSPLIVVPVLLAAGLTRSMQFTALATIAFADIEPHQRASSSTLSSMMQQVSMGLGVAVGAFLLNASQNARGADHLALADFRIAFIVAGVIGVGAALLFVRLPADAGSEVSGHAPVRS